MTSALAIDGLTSGYGSSAVITDVSLSLAQAEILALVGKNGMGKTSLLKSILGFLPTWKGTVTLAGRNVTRLAPHLKRRLGLVLVPQEQVHFHDLTIQENLRLGLLNDVDLETQLDRVGRWFPVLLARFRQRAGTLSGGEQKMLVIARALIANPNVMLLDEVTEGLQPSVVDRVAEVLSETRRAQETALLVVEQHVPFALSLADRYAVFKRGEVIETGSVGGSSAERIGEHMKL